MNTKLLFSQRLPKVKNQKFSLLIYDQILSANPKIQNWIDRFPQKYSVKSGETLKDIQQFPRHIENISRWLGTTQHVYVLGGGSVGDFGGFVASVLRRGVPVTQIPSTWLAALDSAHGGKTALNVGGFKNQIGTFHFPHEVWIVKSLLETQPAERLMEASGEFMKTALLGGENLISMLSKWKWSQGKIQFSDLKSFIDVKYSVVKKDPHESKGHRYKLNLGHTMGHVWEAHLGIPHGLAVFHGLLFDLAWSVQKKLMNANRSLTLMDQNPWSLIWDRQFMQKTDLELYSISESKVRHYLSHDKKMKNGLINHTFVKRPGQIIIKPVSIDDILREYRRQQRALQELYENL
ncbi:MAG: hypothetical protein ACK5W9_12670 [Bdellovibrionales bacterium]